MAAKAEHFTGADLKALLYNAQLEAVHANMESSPPQVSKLAFKDFSLKFISGGKSSLYNDDDISKGLCIRINLGSMS